MIKLEDVLKVVNTTGKLFISRPCYGPCYEGEENGEEIIFDGYYDAKKYHNVEPFLDYEVYNIMAGGEGDGMPGVLYIDVYKQEGKK